MNRISLPLLSRNTNRAFWSSKFTVPSIFLLYPNTPPSYFALVLAGAGGGVGIFVELSAVSGVVEVRGRCPKATAAMISRSANAHINRGVLCIVKLHPFK